MSLKVSCPDSPRPTVSQACPLKRSTVDEGASVPPIAQTSLAEIALPRSRPTALPVLDSVQVLPLKCQVPRPPSNPPPPNTHTLLALSAVMPVNSALVPGTCL